MDLETLFERVMPHFRTPHVGAGKDRMNDLVRRHEAGLVWMMDDLSRGAAKKIIFDLMKKDIPCMQLGTSDELEARVFIENIKILTLKKSFPGLKHLIEQLSAADILFTA